MSSTLNYREDIDGLRAIAVSSVVLYHFGIAGFGGGYVGVDIFFAISGYLIGSIVFTQLGKNKFSFSNFYIRRIRRLFPASFAMTVFALLVGYRLLLPAEFRELGQSILASTLYMSNVLFYMKAGYFDSASHMKPLLHTWSLSAEEQFYLIFPLAAWLCYRYAKRAMVAFFSIACLASLIAAAVYIHKDQSAVFYLYPFRAWEMFIGVVVGISKVSFGKLNENRLSSNGLALIGLALVCYPILFYTKDTLFPGLAALSPCVGT
ncbi:MAG TPA: acyltransferase, partial [Pseudomonadales bacterium]|nr:acyltransferase [Pseudomonadales bacterium]